MMDSEGILGTRYGSAAAIRAVRAAMPAAYAALFLWLPHNTVQMRENQ